MLQRSRSKSGRLADKIAAVAGRREQVTTSAIPERAAIEQVRKTRDKFKGKKKVSSLYLDPAIHRVVRDVAHVEEIKPHDIFMTALDEWLQRNGHGSMAGIIAKAAEAEEAKSA